MQPKLEESRSTEDVVAIENTDAIKSTDIEKKKKSIQDEIAKVEKKSLKYKNADWSRMSQSRMNQVSAKWYQLWDDELNSLWHRLSDELDAKTRMRLLKEQRAWIKRKEGNVEAAGMSARGGSLQAQVENTTAKELTRARVYILAGYLAEARNESFTISSEIQDSIDKDDPSLEDVFKKFERKWTFDKNSGACVGIERSETCTYHVKGSNWIVWVTDGVVMSDLDVYGYTQDNILFKVKRNGTAIFYELKFNMNNSINLDSGTSLDKMDNVIICD